MTKELFDMTPFLVESITLNPKTWDKINEIYATEPLKFYELAKKSEWYDNYLISGGSLESEIIAKHALGIICSTFLGENDMNKKVFTIFKNGWRKIYNDVKMLKKLSADTKIKATAQTEKAIGNMSINVIVIALFFALNENIEIDKTSFTEFLHNAMVLAKLEKTQITVPDKEKRKFKKEVGDIENLTQLDDKKSKEKNKVFYAIDATFAENELTTTNVIPKLSQNDILETIAISRTIKDEEITYADFALTIAHLIGITSAYKNVKREFFKKNNETLLAEIALTEKENKTLALKNIQLSEQKTKLQTELAQTKKEYLDYQKQNENKEEISKLKKEVQNLQEQQTELYALRNFMFEQTVEKENTVETIDTVKYTNVKCIVVGGHDTTQKKLRELFPSFIFISASAQSFDKNIIENAQAIFFLTDMMNHALYYFAMDTVNSNMQIAYMHGTNQTLLAKKIINILENK